MSAPLYQNVWETTRTGEHWGTGIALDSRDACDRVAAIIERNTPGIKRIGVVRGYPKQVAA